MPPAIRQELRELLPGGSRLLVVVAAPGEAAAILGHFQIAAGQELRPWMLLPIAERTDLLVTGVGKTCAAAATAAALAQGKHGAVLNAGIAGSLPAPNPLPLLTTLIASEHAFGDEGVALPDGGFQSLSAMGFAPEGTERDAVPGDPVMPGFLLGLLPNAVRGGTATVSTCSGTDGLAAAIAARTGAVAECMEGAAVAYVARRMGSVGDVGGVGVRVRYGELRVISNTTGDRAKQVWSLRPSLARLGEVVAAVVLGRPENRAASIN